MKKRAPTVSRTRSRASAVAARRNSLLTASRRTEPRSKARAAQKPEKSGRTQRSAKMTVNHAQIRRWVEARGGHPATVKRTVKGKQAGGVLRIDFPGFSGAQSLKPLSWDEWFKTFDERRLAFLYQDKTAGGKQSRFNKLVCRK